MNEVYRTTDSVLKLSRVGYEAVNDGLSVSYYLDGFLHRDDDEPSYVDLHGTKKWHKEGTLHRITGPAVISSSKTDSKKVYYLGGNEVTGQDREDFIKLIDSPIEEVPLFINHPLLCDVAKQRLENNE